MILDVSYYNKKCCKSVSIQSSNKNSIAFFRNIRIEFLSELHVIKLNFEPSLIKFCQDAMRHKYNKFVSNDCIGQLDFP